jgi:hypothetical protein
MTVMDPWPILRIWAIIPSIIIAVLLHIYVFKKYSNGFWHWAQTVISFALLEWVIVPFLIILSFELILG